MSWAVHITGAALVLGVAAVSMAARRQAAGKLKLFLAPAAILALLFNLAALLFSEGVRMKDGSDLASAQSRAEYIISTVKSEAAEKSLTGQRLILITRLAPEGAAANQELQITLDAVAEGLKGWRIEAIRVPSGFAAFKSAELEKALKGKTWDVLVSLVGLPQDLDGLASGELGGLCANRVVIVGAGPVEDIGKALELKVFDRALAPDSGRNRNYGTCLHWKGSNQVVDIRGQRSP